MNKKDLYYDVAIIGGGSAGLTAGIYCGRANLKTIIFEKSLVGGMITNTNEIANYPGYPADTTGKELMKAFKDQAEEFGCEFKLTEAKNLTLDAEDKTIETFRERFHCKTIIIANGSTPRVTGAENEKDFLYNKGISFCSTCDAAATEGKEVLVVGSGDAAIEEAEFLTRFADKIYISVLHDEGVMDCNEIAKEAILKNPKVEIIWNSAVKRFEGEDQLERVVLNDVRTNEEINLDLDTCFLFIGAEPNSDLVEGVIDLDERGYIITNEDMETNIDGVFACGDCRSKTLRQVSTAVGDGAIAGVMAERYIAEGNQLEQSILAGGAESLVYIHDASVAEDRDLLPILQEAAEEAGVKLNVIDIYKSTGLAKRLGVEIKRGLAHVKNNEVIAYHDENLGADVVVELVK